MPKEVSTLLRDYGVEEVSDLGQMQVSDYEQAGLTTDQFQAISRYISSNKFEVISKELTLYTSRVLGHGSTSNLEVVEVHVRKKKGKKQTLILFFLRASSIKVASPFLWL